MTFVYARSNHQPLAMVSSVEPAGFTSLGATLNALLSDPRHVPATPVLIDLRTLTDAHVEQALALAENIGQVRQGWRGRFALVTAGRPEAIVERAWTMYLRHQGLNAQLFTDLDAAKAWLAGDSAVQRSA